MTIGTRKNHNKEMQAFLRSNGFPYAVPQLIEKGSQRGTWRIYSKPKGGSINDYDLWTPAIIEKLTLLGFVNSWGNPLDQYDGNGGVFSVFVRKEGKI